MAPLRTPSKSLLTAALLLGGWHSAAFAQGTDPDNEKLLQVYETLDPSMREEVVEWYRAEIKAARTYQGSLVAFVLGGVDHDPRDWPAAADQPPLYRAEDHAKAQLIPRIFVAKPTSKERAWIERVFRARASDPTAPGWSYDFGRGTVVRHRGRSDPDHTFALALAGRVPDADLAQAIVALTLDRGRWREAHAAFAHAYSDRRGRAHAAVTLYDAWGSGLEMEMPDVECLGIVHDVFDDWKTWVAPVPASRHKALYKRIGEVFVDLRADRELRESLAATYLQGDPLLAATQLPHRDRLHALWAQVNATPLALTPSLPDTAKGLQSFWEARGKQLDGNRDLWATGQVRRKALLADSQTARRTLIWVMRQLELLPPG